MSAPTPAEAPIAPQSPADARIEARSGAKSRPRLDAAAALQARAEQRAAWPPVRQPISEDVPYLKGLLRARGLTRIVETEPATVPRLRQLLRRAGLSQGQVEEAVGLSLAELIERNPGVALWWLTATTLEASA